MKKMISLVLATAMVFAMSAVVFAADSITDATVESTTETTGVNGTVTAASGFGSDTDAQATASTAISTEISYSSYTAYAFNLTLSTDGSITDGTVIVAVTGISKGDSIIVLHYTSGNIWVKVSGAYVNSDGKVVIPGLNDLSPFMVIKDTTTSTSSSSSATIFGDAYGYWNAAGEYVWYGYWENGVFIYTTDPAATTTTTTAASPKTGETNATAVALSLVCMAGFAVYGLTRKEQN